MTDKLLGGFRYPQCSQGKLKSCFVMSAYGGTNKKKTKGRVLTTRQGIISPPAFQGQFIALL